MSCPLKRHGLDPYFPTDSTTKDGGHITTSTGTRSRPVPVEDRTEPKTGTQAPPTDPGRERRSHFPHPSRTTETSPGDHPDERVVGTGQRPVHRQWVDRTPPSDGSPPPDLLPRTSVDRQSRCVSLWARTLDVTDVSPSLPRPPLSCVTQRHQSGEIKKFI